MRVVKASSKEITSHLGDKDRFHGEVLIQDLVDGRFEKDINVNRVSFKPGARTHWHRHPGGQVLYVISGIGRVGSAGKNLEAGQRESGEIGPEDRVWIEALERHWHGAGPEQEMTHIAINPTVSPEMLEEHYQKDWSREVNTNEYKLKNQQLREKS